jgi:vitamin-K-epoxide reductase (warfarin-sensitive)
MFIGAFVVSLIGVCLSCAALWVVRHPSVQAWCDISSSVSCTKAFSSPYGSIFGLHNALIGICFYLLTAMFAIAQNIVALRVLSAIAIGGSVLLAYDAYIRLRTFCVVCTAIYATNVALAIVSWLQ